MGKLPDSCKVTIINSSNGNYYERNEPNFYREAREAVQKLFDNEAKDDKTREKKLLPRSSPKLLKQKSLS